MRISVRRIQELVAADFGVPAAKMAAPRARGRYARENTRDVAHARQCAMLLARELTPLSLPVIGKLFHRDHSTIVHGLREAKKRVDADKNLAIKLEARALLLKSETEARPLQIPSEPIHASAQQPVSA